MKRIIDVPEEGVNACKLWVEMGVASWQDKVIANGIPCEEGKNESDVTDILEQIIAEINTSNRGTCDYYIVDRIEEIINEYLKGGAE